MSETFKKKCFRPFVKRNLQGIAILCDKKTQKEVIMRQSWSDFLIPSLQWPVFHIHMTSRGKRKSI